MRIGDNAAVCVPRYGKYAGERDPHVVGFSTAYGRVVSFDADTVVLFLDESIRTSSRVVHSRKRPYFADVKDVFVGEGCRDLCDEMVKHKSKWQ